VILKKQKNPIGGYFELELNSHRNKLDKWGVAYQSARASLYALIKQKKCERIWLPKYICGCVIPPIESLDIEILKYDIDLDFRIKSKIPLRDTDLLLYVNYFGICDLQEEELISEYTADQIIFDHSQAFYSRPKDVAATIFSPRKFFGLPDGGFLYTNTVIEDEYEVDTDSIERSKFLLTRLSSGAEAGYNEFKIADESLNDFYPKKMSTLTRKLLSSVDIDSVKTQRNINFNYLHSRLKKINELVIPNNINAPLCYPLLIRLDGLRDFLIKNKLFIAKYWPDVMESVDSGSVEDILVNNLLAIPCDQRYQEKDMNDIIDLIFIGINEIKHNNI
jgi:hypothetical protein